MSAMQIPDTVRALLAPDVLSAVVDALAPKQRAQGIAEVEVEVKKQGTFTLRYVDGALTGKKGFAKNALLSATLDDGAWRLTRDELQIAVDGFPQAPALAARLAQAQGLDPAIGASLLSAVEKLPEGLCIHFVVSGEGRFSVARGAVDEATRELTITIPGTAVRGLLAGAPLSSLTFTMSGDRSLGAAVATAMTPIMHLVRP